MFVLLITVYLNEIVYVNLREQFLNLNLFIISSAYDTQVDLHTSSLLICCYENINKAVSGVLWS